MRAFEREQDSHGEVQQANGIQQADDTGTHAVAAQAAVSGQKNASEAEKAVPKRSSFMRALVNHRSDTAVAEHLDKERMRNTAVDDVRSRDTALARHHAAFDFRNHAAGDCSVVEVFLHVVDFDSLDEAVRVVHVLQDTGDVRELHEFLGLEGDGYFRGGRVGVDVVAVRVAVLAQSDRRDYGDEARVQKRLDDFWVNFRHLAHEAQIGSVLVDFLCAEETRVNARKSDGFSALLQEDSHDVLVEFSGQNHLHDFHRLGIGVAESVHELGLLPHPVEHLVDFRAAAVDENDLDSDSVQENDVLHDSRFQILVEHSVPAVLHDDSLPDPMPEIRQRLNQNLRPMVVVKPYIIHKKTPLFL